MSKTMKEIVCEKIYGMDYQRLKEQLDPLRAEGKTVVMCSGTFDLCHPGHMNMINAAKDHGDILVVAVKSKRAAAKKKLFPPVISEEDRLYAVANMMAVDYVIMVDFEPFRPVHFILDNTSSHEWLNMFEPAVSVIRPDIFVHEENPEIVHARAQLFEKYDIKGVIQQRTKGVSTTQIIDTIKTQVLIENQRLLQGK